MPPKKKQDKCSKFEGSLHTLDMYGEDVNFRENGQDQFTSTTGSVISLIIMILVGCYAVEKFTEFLTFNDTMH